MKKTFISLLTCLFIAVTSFSQTSYCGTVLQVDDCANAPNPSICELDGFSSNTIGFSTGLVDQYLQGFCGPGTGIQNSMWIGFTAATTQIHILFDVSNCAAGTGLQAAIVETDCATYATSLTCVGAVPTGATGPFTLNAAGLTIGDPYYIMIDGYAGDECDFSLQVLEGLPDVSFTAEILDPFPICASGDFTTLIAQANPPGSYIYQWFDPQGNVIPFATSSSIGVDQIGTYTVQVHETVNCCFAEASTTVTLATNVPVASLVTAPNDLILDCNSFDVTLTASISPDGNYYYTWVSQNGTDLGSGLSTSISDITVSEPGIYTFIVIDNNTGCSDQIEAEVTNIINTNSSCTYTLVLEDSMGDGWDGASIDVSIAEAWPATNYKMTLSDGFITMIPINVNEGETIDLTYWNGAFEEQHSFELRNAEGNIVDDVNGIPIDYNGSPPTNQQIRTFTSCIIDDFRILTSLSQNGNVGQSCFDMRVQNFNNLELVQYSMHWDDTAIQFSHVDVPLGNTGFGLDVNDFFLFNSSTLVQAWNYSGGVTIPDDSLWCTICFDVLACNSTSPITFDDNPISMEISEVGNPSTIINDFCIMPIDLGAIDTGAPVCIVQDVTLSFDQTGTISILPSDLDNGSYDDCVITSIQVVPDVINCSSTSPVNVALIVTDALGNSSSCQATVTVVDNSPPVCSAYGNITIFLDENGQASILPSDLDNGSFDNCAIANMNISTTTFDCNSIGFNSVDLIVMDDSGNQNTCRTIVEVKDVFGACCPDYLYANQLPIVDGTYTAHIQMQSISIVPNGNVVNFKAGTQICLDSGFEVELGAEFQATIEDCNN